MTSQPLADVIGFFWQFHKQRVQDGEISFAPHFDPQSALHWAQNTNQQYAVVSHYSHSVQSSLMGSFSQMLDSQKISVDPDELGILPPLTEKSRKFVNPYGIGYDPYFKGLLDKAQQLGELSSTVYCKDGYTVQRDFNAGTDAAAKGTVHLKAIFGEQFDPLMALALSRTHLDNLGLGLSMIGVETPRISGEEPFSYALLSNGGLNQERLKDLGRGACPAGIRMSPTSRQVLASRGILVEKTALEEFASMVSTDFDSRVGEWYRGLSPEVRQFHIDPENSRLLNGEIYRSTFEQSPKMMCPYSKERG